MAEILIIEDNRGMREGLELVLRRKGHRTRIAASGAAGLDLLAEKEADLVITDLKMSRMDGLEVLRRIKEEDDHVDVMVISAHGTIEEVVEAMRLGAADFIEKPFSSEEFAVKVARIIRDGSERRRLKQENVGLRVQNAELQSGKGDLPRYGRIIGASDTMRKVFRWIERVGPTDSTITIYGESGTGKELVARAIHAASARRDEAFVAVHCGALPETLIESELFGHEKGAFTGAEKKRRGRFELAHRGTLFLDEIGTFPEQTQVRLLRVLQEREVERLGGERSLKIDVRIIAATNVPPEVLRESAFRDDLFYRLHVITTSVPPLRERVADIPLLVDHFIDKYRDSTGTMVKSASKDALRVLMEHDWPGNVRELENIVQTALVLADGPELLPEDVPKGRMIPADPGGSGERLSQIKELVGSGAAIDLTAELENAEEEVIRHALAAAGGVKSKAARLLGLKPTAFRYRLEKYGLPSS